MCKGERGREGEKERGRREGEGRGRLKVRFQHTVAKAGGDRSGQVPHTCAVPLLGILVVCLVRSYWVEMLRFKMW